jgi:E3 ubiquitin-protein ligase NEDD4
MRALICEHGIPRGKTNTDTDSRRASEESILAVQIFDQKKFKKKDQGFLGVINVRVGDVVDFSSGQDRK